MALTEEQRLRRNAYMREWKARNADKHRAWSRQYYRNNQGHCRARELARYYENHDEIRDKQRVYYQDNSERILAHNKSYRQSHAEQVALTHKAWRSLNPDKIASYAKQDRLRRRHAPGFCTNEQLQARIDYYGGKCWMCGDPWEHIDHVKPVSKGGSNWPGNLRPACGPCNQRKSDRWPYPTVK